VRPSRSASWRSALRVSTDTLMVVVRGIPGSIPLPQLGGCAPQDGAHSGRTSGRRRRVRERGLPQRADRLNVDGHQLTGTIPLPSATSPTSRGSSWRAINSWGRSANTAPMRSGGSDDDGSRSVRCCQSHPGGLRPLGHRGPSFRAPACTPSRQPATPISPLAWTSPRSTRKQCEAC
jgi:hypothetical protein